MTEVFKVLRVTDRSHKEGADKHGQPSALFLERLLMVVAEVTTVQRAEAERIDICKSVVVLVSL